MPDPRILGMPNPFDPGGDVSITDEEREKLERQKMSEFLLSNPQETASTRHDEWLGQNKWGRTGKKILDALAVGASSFGNNGREPAYKGQYANILAEEQERYKQQAPLMQRDLASTRTTQQREADSVRDAQTADNKLKEQVKQAAANYGLKAEQIDQGWDKLKATIPLLGAQTALTQHKAALEKEKAEYAQNNQAEMGKIPGSVLDARATAIDKDTFDGKALQAYIKNMFGGSGSGGSTSTTTRETRKQVKDQVTGITSWVQGEPLTSTTQRSGTGGGNKVNPLVQQMLENRVLQHPMFGGTGSFASTPAGPGPTPKPAAKAPAPVSGRPTSGASIAASAPRFWEVPIPEGTSDAATTNKHQGRQKTFASLERVSTIFNSAQASGLSGLGTGPITSMDKVLLARRIFRDIKPMEAQLRRDLSSVQAKELLEFTGKQANERDRVLIENMVPTGKESDVELLTKTIFFRLALEYERLMDGDVIQKRPSMKPELRSKFDSGVIVRQTHKLVDRFMKGKAMTAEDFNMKRLYAAEAVGQGIPAAEWLK